MDTQGSNGNGTATSPNHDDGVNATEGTPAPKDERFEVPTAAASSENVAVPASAVVERAPHGLGCRRAPHGAYACVPALLSAFAWFA